MESLSALHPGARARWACYGSPAASAMVARAANSAQACAWSGPQGRRIDEDYARRAAEYDAATVRRGRRSLSGGHTHSPRVSFRVPEDLRDAAERAAARAGRTVSELAREALQKDLAS